MSQRTGTKGQMRVKADFNPSKNELVDQIKNKAAELIDLIEELRGNQIDGDYTADRHRLISLAQTDVESAAMWAVKANFTD